MKNKLEIEKKYYIKNSSIEELSKIIEKLGAKHVGDNKQQDIYFNVPGRDSLKSKECLRIRGSEAKTEITYKPATKQEDVNNGFFAKEEINLPINDTVLATTLLLNIGCEILAEVKKERKRYTLDKFKIFIDNISNVGLFLEIEILDIEENVHKCIADIDNLFLALNIADYTVEDKPYRDIVIETQKGGTRNDRGSKSNPNRPY